MQPAITKKLEDYRTLIDKAIGGYFDSPQSKFGLVLRGAEKAAFDALEEFSRRPGKRLRGALAIFIYEYFAKSKNPSVLKMALALELTHNYLIIIDDVMDRSDRRRGDPSLHKILVQDLTPGAETEHLGHMNAINIALIAQHTAALLLCQVDEKPANIIAASKTLHKNMLRTGYGQIDDLANIYNKSADEKTILRMCELKNYYTFTNPLQLGAAMAGKDSAELMAHLEAIGRSAGVAFQLQDDLLGLFGDPKATGKSAADDLREGKFTLLIRYTIDHAAAEDVKTVRSALGNIGLTDRMHQEVKAIVEKCGAKNYVEAKAQSYCQAAKNELAGSTFFDQTAKDFLNGVMDFVINRKT